MTRMYVNLVIAGIRTCNESNKEVPIVPAKWRGKVLAKLEADGRDADGHKVQ